MINLCYLGQVYIVCGKTNMRKGIDTLAFLVKEKFQTDPFAGHVFLFCGGKQERFMAFYCEGQGNALKMENYLGLIIKVKFRP